MLGVMRGNVETGYYAAAYRTYEGMSYLPSIIAAVLTPRLAGLFVRDRGGHPRAALPRLGGRPRARRRRLCVHARDAAARSAVRRRVPRGGRAVSHPLHRPAARLRD